MKRVKVEQGTIEWFEARYAKIGGSTSKGLFVKSDTLMLDLLSQHLEDYEPEDGFISDAMERGNDLEPEAIKQLRDYTGKDFKAAGWLQCEEVPLLGISPDAITDCDEYSAETKCPGRKKHTETIVNDVIPSDHLHQCIHYFTVNPKLEKHYFASFRPENKLKPLFVKELTRDTVVDLGTKRKPELKTVAEWSEIARTNAIEIQKQINANINKLEF